VLAVRSAVQLLATERIFLPRVCCTPKETTEDSAVRHALVGPRTDVTSCCGGSVNSFDACVVIGVYQRVTVLECSSLWMVRGRRNGIARL